MKRKLIVLATLTGLFGVCAGATTATFAHQGATGIVKERMNAMQDIGDGLKAIGLMVRGKRKFDATQVRASASVIKKHSSDFQRLFPKGSIKGPSEAVDKIWTDWSGFKAIADDLARYAEALEGADGADPAKVSPTFAKMAGTCKSCHQDYRKKKK